MSGEVTNIPCTSAGKILVIKSTLAKAWYMVTNQTPPCGIVAELHKWEKAGWEFFKSNKFGSSGIGAQGAVKRTVLTQDYAETGSRCIDVRIFIRAILATWVVRRLPHPSPMPWKNIAWYFINKEYGHLRQGNRLLTSTCDFLRLKSAPPFWKNALQCAGMLSHLAPNVNQDGADPHYTGKKIALQRSVKCKFDWSISEIAMEPLFYNPHMGGRWGGRPTDPPGFQHEAREKDMKQHRGDLNSISVERNQESESMYDVSVRMSDARFTHMAHLITLERLGDPIALMNWSEFCSAAKRTSRRNKSPLSETSFRRLIDAIPSDWKRNIKIASDARNGKRAPSLLKIIQQIKPVAWEWVQLENKEIRQVQVNGHSLGPPYELRPSGRLQKRTGNFNDYYLSPPYPRIAIVWPEEKLAHCLLQQEAQERAQARGDAHLQPDAKKPTELIMGGYLVDPNILDCDLSSPSNGGTNLTLFARDYGTTDRKREKVNTASLDVHKMYYMMLSHLFEPVRSFDPKHIVPPNRMEHKLA